MLKIKLMTIYASNYKKLAGVNECVGRLKINKTEDNDKTAGINKTTILIVRLDPFWEMHVWREAAPALFFGQKHRVSS